MITASELRDISSAARAKLAVKKQLENKIFSDLCANLRAAAAQGENKFVTTAINSTFAKEISTILTSSGFTVAEKLVDAEASMMEGFALSGTYLEICW